MNTHQKKSAKATSNRPRAAVRTLTKLDAARSVVLDSVGFLIHRRGGGVLRLKLIGPVENLRRLRLQVGDRLNIGHNQLTGEHAA